MSGHGEGFLRGEMFATQSEEERRASVSRLGLEADSATVPVGKFGRIFEGLPAYEAPDAAIRELAETMKEDDVGDDSDIPLGFAFLGQFIDHDVTLDPVSRLDERLDPAAVRNFRTPALDLDNVYGEGPDASRHLYDTRGDDMESEHRLPFRLLTGAAAGHPRDLPRNAQGTAIIGDPRNDENLLISQVHAAFLRFHNAVVRHLLKQAGGNKPNNKELFEQARRIVTTHYHWVIVNEFLPLVVGDAVVKDVVQNGRRFYKWEDRSDRPYIPVEFSGAAYRMGHTLIRNTYRLNDMTAEPIGLFDLPFFGLEKPSPDAGHAPVSGGYSDRNILDFSYFVDLGATGKLQFCRKIDAKVVKALFDLPFIHRQADAPESLPERNMRRGRTLGLPSGQKIAAQMGITPLTNDQLGIAGVNGLGGEAPLWFYILKESELGGTGRLGPVAGRIVTETLLALIEFVQRTFDGNFKLDQLQPSLPTASGGFSFADLVTFGDA